MNHCDVCDVDIEGSQKRCPLCKNQIKNYQKSNDIFPVIPTIYESHKKLFHSLLAISLVVALIVIVINFFATPHVLWSAFVILGILSSWGLIYITINKKSNIIRLAFYQSLIISTLCILWDVFTGWHNWSIDFVLPITYTVGIVLSFIMGLIMKMDFKRTIIYVMLNILLGLIPAILIVVGALKVVTPSIISVVTSNTLLIVLAIFEGQNIIDELQKRFHI